MINGNQRMNGLVVRVLSKAERIFKFMTVTAMAIMLFMPYVVLSAIPMNDGVRLVIMITATIPYIFVYMTVMFKLMDWFDRKEIEE